MQSNPEKFGKNRKNLAYAMDLCHLRIQIRWEETVK